MVTTQGTGITAGLAIIYTALTITVWHYPVKFLETSFGVNSSPLLPKKQDSLVKS